MKPVQRPLAAIFVLPFVGALLVYSLGTGHFVPFSIFILCLAGCCLVYAVLSRFGVKLDAQIPSRVTEGDSIGLSMLLRSRSWVPKFVSLSAAEVVQPLNRHTQAKRRQEHKLFFRQHSDSMQTENADKYLMEGFILRRGLSRIHRELELPYRGIVIIRNLKLSFSDPLGIFAISKTFKLNHEILVRVRPSFGSALLQITGSSGRLETKMKVGETGEMTEFAGTRPFRDGDELRHIHWPTVARTGELYVREYTPSSAESIIVLLLRNHREAGKAVAAPVLGEFILRAAVALVIELFNRRIHVVFGTNTRGGQAINIGYSQVNLQQFHDRISSVEWDEEAVPVAQVALRLETAGMESPHTIVFCVDSPVAEDFMDISRLLYLHYNRITAVVGADETSARARGTVPSGIRTIYCNSESPDKLFTQLSM